MDLLQKQRVRWEHEGRHRARHHAGDAVPSTTFEHLCAGSGVDRSGGEGLSATAHAMVLGAHLCAGMRSEGLSTFAHVAALSAPTCRSCWCGQERGPSRPGQHPVHAPTPRTLVLLPMRGARQPRTENQTPMKQNQGQEAHEKRAHRPQDIRANLKPRTAPHLQQGAPARAQLGRPGHQLLHVHDARLTHARLVALPQQRHKRLQRVLLRPALAERRACGLAEPCAHV